MAFETEMADDESEKESPTSNCDSENEAASGSDSEKDAASHAAALKRLKDKDPEFYEFLQENDKQLLNFEDSEGEDIVEEEDEESKDQKPLTAPKLEYIRTAIKKSPSIKLCKALISAFKHAVHLASGTGKDTDMSGVDLFSDVMKLCLIELVPALTHVLKLSPEEGKKRIDPAKSKLWRSTQSLIKSYLINLLKLFTILRDSSALVLLLKHTIHLVPFFSKFIKLSKLLLKRMILLWCSEEDTVRVLSLIVIVRTTKLIPNEYFSQIVKSMYFSFVKNIKFTSPNTWPMINFMKRSLTEVYALKPEIAYEHAFVYMRQLAIHLRNAITIKKKESFQTVYNWQYVHCLMFWSHLICRLHHHEALKTLVYPLVQTITGTITLIPTAKYVPLRFHLVRSLMQISQETGNFIPTLPFILDVLRLVDYNKKSAFSVRAQNFDCSLKVTKSQLQEIAFKNRCITGVCDLLVDYLKIYAHSIGFPELSLPAKLQIRSFMKQCKIAKYNHQLKPILGKIEENASVISEKRRSVAFNMTNTEEIKAWEQNMLQLKPPLLRFEKPQEVEEIVHNKKMKVSETTHSLGEMEDRGESKPPILKFGKAEKSEGLAPRKKKKCASKKKKFAPK